MNITVNAWVNKHCYVWHAAAQTPVLPRIRANRTDLQRQSSHDWRSMPDRSAPAHSKLDNYLPLTVVSLNSRSLSSLPICFSLFLKENEKQDLNVLLGFTQHLPETSDLGANCPSAQQARAPVLLATSSPPSATKTSGHPTARRSPSSSGALVQRDLEKVFHLPHLFPEPPPSLPLSWLTTFIDKNLTFYAIWEHLALASAACLPSPGSAKHAVTYQPLLTG